MADEAPAKETKTEKKQGPEQVVYYAFDRSGRIRDTVCLWKIEIPDSMEQRLSAQPYVFYARGATYFSNTDHKANVGIRAGVRIAVQRAGKVAEWFMQEGHNLEAYARLLEKDYNGGKFFGEGTHKIDGDKMRLLTPDKLSLEDKFWLGQGNELFDEVERRNAAYDAKRQARRKTSAPVQEQYVQFLSRLADDGLLDKEAAQQAIQKIRGTGKRIYVPDEQATLKTGGQARQTPDPNDPAYQRFLKEMAAAGMIELDKAPNQSGQPNTLALVPGAHAELELKLLSEEREAARILGDDALILRTDEKIAVLEQRIKDATKLRATQDPTRKDVENWTPP